MISILRKDFFCMLSPTQLDILSVNYLYRLLKNHIQFTELEEKIPNIPQLSK